MKRLTWCCGLLCMYRRFLLTTAHVRRVIIRFEKGKKKTFSFLPLVDFFIGIFFFFFSTRVGRAFQMLSIWSFSISRAQERPGHVIHQSGSQQPATSIFLFFFCFLIRLLLLLSFFFGSPASEFNQSNPSVEPVPKGGKVPLSQHRCV